MRKLLSSKRHECDGKVLCNSRNCVKMPIALSKRTISNNWNTRNDSFNVNAILHPENFLLSTRKSIEQQKDKSKSAAANVKRKCCLTTNTCYCRETGTQPKILTRPRSCLTVEEVKKRVDIPSLNRKPIKKCLCSGFAKKSDLTNQDLLKLHEENPESDRNELQPTDLRKDYENYRSMENEKDLEQLLKLDEEQQHEALSISTLMPTIHGTSEDEEEEEEEEGADNGYSELDSMDIGKLRKFRDQHYFETHGEDLSVQQGVNEQHTCLHQYELDNRFVPVPLNPDLNGMNKCKICSKTSFDDETKSSKISIKENPRHPSSRAHSKYYQTSNVPKTICFETGDRKIELKVNEYELDKFDYIIGKIKMPQYKNTFALRQQKMKYY